MLRRRLPAVAAVTAAWMLGWVLIVTSAAARGVDHPIDAPLLALGPAWQGAAVAALDAGQPLVCVGVVVALAAACLVRRRPGATAVVTALAAEVVSVQWVLKPLVHRHEVAPGAAFPSSYAAAAAAAATLVALSVRPGGPIGLWRPLAVALVGAATLGAVAVGVATLITGGHRASDVLAALPWGAGSVLVVAGAVETASGDRRPRP